MQVLALCHLCKSVLLNSIEILLNSFLRQSEIQAHIIPESTNVPQSRFPPRDLKVFLVSFQMVPVSALLQIFRFAFLG